MSTENKTKTDSTSVDRIGKKAITRLQRIGVYALLGTFMIGYALGIVVLSEFFAQSGFWQEVGLITKIAIETAVAVPVVASMVLSARHVLSMFDINTGEWEQNVLLAAGVTWVLFPPVVAVWPSIGVF